MDIQKFQIWVGFLLQGSVVSEFLILLIMESVLHEFLTGISHVYTNSIVRLILN